MLVHRSYSQLLTFILPLPLSFSRHCSSRFESPPRTGATRFWSIARGEFLNRSELVKEETLLLHPGICIVPINASCMVIIFDTYRFLISLEVLLKLCFWMKIFVFFSVFIFFCISVFILSLINSISCSTTYNIKYTILNKAIKLIKFERISNTQHAKLAPTTLLKLFNTCQYQILVPSKIVLKRRISKATLFRFIKTTKSHHLNSGKKFPCQGTIYAWEEDPKIVS